MSCMAVKRAVQEKSFASSLGDRAPSRVLKKLIPEAFLQLSDDHGSTPSQHVRDGGLAIKGPMDEAVEFISIAVLVVVVRPPLVHFSVFQGLG